MPRVPKVSLWRCGRVASVCAVALLLGGGAGGAASGGCAWRLSPSVLPRGESGFDGLDARASDDVWAVGAQAKGTTLAEHWDGARWRVTPAGGGDLTAVVAVGKDDAWAVGERGKRPLIEHWNGARWEVVAGANTRPGTLWAVDSRSPSDVWAVGSDDLVEHWDGHRWQVAATPRWAAKLGLGAVSLSSDGEVWTSCLRSRDGARWMLSLPPGTSYGNACIYGGSTAVDAHDPTDVWVDFGVVARWDGARRRRHPHYASDVTVASLAALSPNDVWAAGWQNCCGGASYDYLAHWDGIRWREAHSALPYDVANELTAISAVSPRDIWAAGTGAGKARVERYTCRRS